MITTGKTLLRVHKLGMMYDENVIFQNISFEIKDIISDTPSHPKGQIVSIFGRSGIGKTQLCRIIAGIKTPTEGDVTYFTDDDNFIPKAGDVGFVFQNYPLLEHRTVWDNLMVVCNDKEKITHHLALFNLWVTRNNYPSQISGGQRQRVAIIQQLLHAPKTKIYIMDEPFSGLDPAMVKVVANSIRTIADLDENNIVILISHDIESSVEISDQAIVLRYNAAGGVICREYDLLSANLARISSEIKSIL